MAENAKPDRLLVVDDDESSRDMLSRWLTRKGYEVESACSGAEALAKQQSCAFDLILLDNMMPGMSGMDVLNRLRETLSETDLPIIMVTAQSGNENVSSALLLGANDFLVKPVDINLAVSRIETHLARKLVTDTMRAKGAVRGVCVQPAEKGTWDWHLTTGRIHFSQEWKSMLGYSDAEIRSAPEVWFRRIHPDDQARLRTELSAHLASSRIEFNSEYRMKHRDGRLRQMRCSALTTRDSSGAARRLTGTQVDLSRTT